MLLDTAPSTRVRYAPTLGGLLVAMALVWVMFYTVAGLGGGLLEDAGAGVHVRTGEWILDHGSVPRVDVFTFSAAGKPWYAWEWLSDVIFGSLHRIGGLRAVVVFSAALIVITAGMMLGSLARRSGDAIAAILLFHIFLGASSVHFFSRPHLFTLLLFAVSMKLLDCDDRRQWLLVPIAALWANLHGGFVGLLATLAVMMRWRLLAACSIATLLNPYGWELHRHVLDYLQAGWIRNIVAEFQPPKLDTAAGVYFEVLLFLALMGAAYLFSRKRYAEMLAVLLWSHAAMTSVRHVPILAIVALPFVADAISEVISEYRWSRKSLLGVVRNLGEDHFDGVAKVGWLPAVGLACLLLVPSALYRFPAPRYPVELAARQASVLSQHRVATPDYWGDYLIYQGQKAFFDGRTDLFGPEFSAEYMQLLEAAPGWREIATKYGINAALLPDNSPLARQLREQPNWHTADAAGGAVLLLRDKL